MKKVFDMKEILPSKRFDKNFKEVYPILDLFFGHNVIGEGQCGQCGAIFKTIEGHKCKYEGMQEAYNKAQQRKVLVPISEFVKLLRSDWESQSQLSRQAEASKRYRKIDKYIDYITQPITEKSLEGVEFIIQPNGGLGFGAVWVGLKDDYKTIEHAINDGVLFILKD